MVEDGARGRLRRWAARALLAPPVLGSEAQTEHARTFWLVAVSALAIHTGVLGLVALQRAEGRSQRLATIAALWLLTTVLLVLNRRGWTRTASWCLVLGLIAGVTQRAWMQGGLNAPVAPLCVIYVMMAGVLLGTRGGVITALVCVAGGVGLALAEEAGTLTAVRRAVPARVQLLYFAGFMGLTLLLQRLIVSSLRHGLRRNERLVHHLQERVKELRLLSAVARLQQEDHPSARALLTDVVGLIPAGWQYAECCEARIVHGSTEVATPGWRDSPWTQSTEFSTSEGPGRIDVAYTQPRPPAAEGPFLAEERTLIESVARILGRQLDVRKHRQGLEDLVATRTAELRALERLRDDLVNMVVHDMRSPLMVLTMRLERLKSQVAEGQHSHVEGALRSALALTRMAEALLDVRRLEEGKMPIERAACDLSQLAGEVRAALAPMDPQRTIEVDCPAPVEVAGDTGLLRRVMENLVSNAFKHTPSGGRVRIAVDGRTERARITVQDEGAGVPVEARQRIFEKFGTVAARQDGSYHSAGLGLAFCKLAVEAHGGAIGVEAVEPHGSLFWVELPR